MPVSHNLEKRHWTRLDIDLSRSKLCKGAGEICKQKCMQRQKVYIYIYIKKTQTIQTQDQIINK